MRQVCSLLLALALFAQQPSADWPDYQQTANTLIFFKVRDGWMMIPEEHVGSAGRDLALISVPPNVKFVVQCTRATLLDLVLVRMDQKHPRTMPARPREVKIHMLGQRSRDYTQWAIEPDGIFALEEGKQYAFVSRAGQEKESDPGYMFRFRVRE